MEKLVCFMIVSNFESFSMCEFYQLGAIKSAFP
ncbi:hypothetical protein RCH09_003393 [Actimicrobium sp. GrIS 1.19]|nr:hypothetical protein [Actimicrobium sp. GrIS 1.19]